MRGEEKGVRGKERERGREGEGEEMKEKRRGERGRERTSFGTGKNVNEWQLAAKHLQC